jgi:flagellar biosynthesis protein FlhG
MKKPALTNIRISSHRTENRSRSNRIYAVAGGKGGIGKTVLTAIMGITLASLGKKTVVVDADFSGPNLHNCMGIQNPPVSVKDFFSRKESNINNLLLDTQISNLRLLSGSVGVLGLANYRYWEKQKFIRHAHNIDADFILMDLGAGTSFNEIDLFLSADVGIVVATPEPPAIQESYNFISICLFRILQNIFRNESKLANIFSARQLLLHTIDSQSLQSITGQILTTDDGYNDKIRAIYKSFKPKLLMNMVESQADCEEGLALQIASRDILNIEVDYAGYVPFDNRIRKAVKAMRPDWLTSEKLPSYKYVHRAVESIMLNGHHKHKKITQEYEELETTKKTYPKDPYEHDVICSVKCSHWGHCRAQLGGYPCRIKHIGYISQESSRES